jgi:glycosyltransferase 2 family protein
VASALAMSRQRLVLAGKLAIGVLLIVWLVRSGTLDFGALSVLFDRPALLIANLAVFTFTTVLGALRWRLLLRLADVRLSVGRALQLALTAVFFNVVAPGNIGGDVIKSIYVARGAAPDRRTSVFVIAFLDRLLALAGLVALAAVLTSLRGSGAWEDPQVRKLSGAVIALALVTFVPPIVLVWIMRRSDKRLETWTQGTTRFGKIVGQLVASARLVSAGPRALLLGLGLAVATHVAGFVWFSTLATRITAQDVSISSMASVYPLGILSVLLPISYAGFGVGHVAFDRLFAMVGLRGGATVLNVYLIGQTVPCLLGVIPYLTLRREAAPASSQV